MSENTILLTGGSGFVGSNLLKMLIQKQYDVHLILRENSNIHRISHVLPKAQVYEHNLENLKSLTKIIKKIRPNYIINLASYGNYPEQADTQQMIQTNIVGIENLLAATKDISYTRFIHTGSSSEYGFKHQPMKESDRLDPNSFYAATKAAGTFLCQVHRKLYNKPIVNLRLFSVYGPGEKKTRFIPTLVRSAISDTMIPLTSGLIRRDFIYIDDVISAYISAMNAKYFSSDYYNIGTGIQYSNLHLVRIVEKILKKKLNIKKGAFPKRKWDTSYWCADISLAKKDLHWKPRFFLEAGLRKTILYYQSHETKTN